MKHLLVLGFLCCLYMTKSNAQDNNWNLFPPQDDTKALDSTNSISYGNIYESTRITNLIEKSVRIDSLNQTKKGYRVQLFSGVGYEAKEDALKIRGEFIAKYAKTPAYLIYDKPNWKVRVGDFDTRLKALEFQRTIYNDFTQGFVVQDEIPIK